MNIKAHHPGFPVWAGAQADIDRVEDIWNECLAASGGPFLFGDRPTMADAMYAPVCTRLRTYDVKAGAVAADYAATMLAMPEMVEWTEAAAEVEPERRRGARRWSSDQQLGPAAHPRARRQSLARMKLRTIG